MYTVKNSPALSPSEPRDLVEDVPDIRIGEILEEAANALRTIGFYSLLDVPNLFIWIFNIPGQSVHEAQRHSELAKLVGFYGLIGKLLIFARSAET